MDCTHFCTIHTNDLEKLFFLSVYWDYLSINCFNYEELVSLVLYKVKQIHNLDERRLIYLTIGSSLVAPQVYFAECRLFLDFHYILVYIFIQFCFLYLQMVTKKRMNLFSWNVLQALSTLKFYIQSSIYLKDRPNF